MNRVRQHAGTYGPHLTTCPLVILWSSTRFNLDEHPLTYSSTLSTKPQALSSAALWFWPLMGMRRGYWFVTTDVVGGSMNRSMGLRLGPYPAHGRLLMFVLQPPHRGP